MISLIICSRDAASLNSVIENAANTIGTPYEVISIDNSQAKYSICEAYNMGAAKAQYDLLCFMHEDIRFHTVGWGETVISTLQDTSIGVLGLTGGRWQVAAPAPWWGCGLELCRENVLNVFPDGHKEMDLRNPEDQMLTDVAVVDGMWMCSRKEVWQQYPFDSRTFSDFHFYDVDYCSEIYLNGLRVCVMFNILVEHHSRGSINTTWIRNALKYEQKRHRQLPFGPAKVSRSQSRRIELRALHEFVALLLRDNFSAASVFSYLCRCLILSPTNRDTLWLLRKWLFGLIFVRKEAIV